MSWLNHFVEGIFFNADSRSYWQPEHYCLTAQKFEQKSRTSNKTISGMLLEPKPGKRRVGTVIFCQPAQFNMSFSLPQVVFLAMRGFQVLTFDYAGSGASTGETSIDGLLEDAQTALDWLDASPFADKNLLFFGEGIGADAALQLASVHPERVKAIILESVYADRKNWLEEQYGFGVGTIAASLLTVTAPNPETLIPEIRAPMMLLRPERDTRVRKGQWSRICQAAPKSAEAYVVQGKPYLGIFADRQGLWHDKVEAFFRKALKKPDDGSKRAGAVYSSGVITIDE